MGHWTVAVTITQVHWLLNPPLIFRRGRLKSPFSPLTTLLIDSKITACQSMRVIRRLLTKRGIHLRSILTHLVLKAACTQVSLTLAGNSATVAPRIAFYTHTALEKDVKGYV